jgi:uncharacterized protein (TIGR02145 family)
MKKILSLLPLLVFISFIILLQSCKKDVNPITPPEPDTILAENTIQVSTDEFTSSLISIDSNKVVLNPTSNLANEIKIGGFLVSEYGEGVLRKIINKQTINNQVTLTTRQARLDEVILKGRIYYSGPVDPQSFTLEAASDTSIKIMKTSTDLTVTFQGVRFGGNSNLDINAGTIFKNPKLVFDVEFDNGIKKFESYLEVTNESYIQVNTSNNGIIIGGSFIPPWARFILPPILTPIGIPIFPKLQFGIGGDINIPISSNTRFDSEIISKIGFGMINFIPYSIAEITPVTTVTSDLEIEGAHLQVYLIFPKVEFYVVDLLGPYFEQQVFVEGNVVSDNLGKYLSVGYGVTGKGGVEFDLFGLLQAGASINIYNKEWEIWKNYISSGEIIPCPGTPTVTYEGKIYNTVQIGNQCWLRENLDVGTMINSSNTYADSMSNNGIIEKYCFDNVISNCNNYGGLYQWNEAMQYTENDGAKGICPIGWHIPTLTEFETLKSTTNNDGNSLKAVGAGTGNGAGTNTSGFSGLLSGVRSYDMNFNFSDFGIHGLFWSSSLDNQYPYLDFALLLDDTDSDITLDSFFRKHGFNVRCIKD